MQRHSKDEQLFRKLKGLCSSLGAGSRFPSVRELASTFSVSSVIANRALKRLQNENLVRCVVGSGTYVTELKPQTRILLLNPNWSGYSPELEAYLRAEATARQYRFQTIIYDYDEEFYCQFARHDADAILVRPSGAPLESHHYAILRSTGVPLVFVKASIHAGGIYSVGGNNVLAGKLAAEYLNDHGHSKLAFLQSEVKDITVEELSAGFSAVCKTRNLRLKKLGADWKFGMDLHQEIYQYLKQQYSKKPPDFTAIFVTNDLNALAVMEAFRDCGLRVPEDISVLGVGGDSKTALFQPPLSLIEVPRIEMAKATFHLLDQLLASEPVQEYRHQVKPILLERNSVCQLQ